MCNSAMLHGSFNGVMDPFAFSTFHLLRSCNRLILPSTGVQEYYSLIRDNNSSSATEISRLHNTFHTVDCVTPTPIKSLGVSLCNEPLLAPNSEILTPETKTAMFVDDKETSTDPSEKDTTSANPVMPTIIPSTNINSIGKDDSTNNISPLPTYGYVSATSATSPSDYPLSELNRVGVFPSFLNRRPRGEKRPIPDAQKDEKYYERRKRNNEAAKKSRDARKIREDRIAFRAALLEQENSILRAQVMALRDELQAIRRLMSPTNQRPSHM